VLGTPGVRPEKSWGAFSAPIKIASGFKVYRFTNPRTMLTMCSKVLCDWKVNEPATAEWRFSVVKPLIPGDFGGDFLVYRGR